MSSFEFLSVFISVIVGLAMANMLTGGVNLIHRRHTVKISLAYASPTLWVFLLMVV